MSTSRLKKGSKSQSRTPPVVQENGMIKPEEPNASTSSCTTTLTSSPLPTTPGVDVKPDLEASLTTDMSSSTPTPVPSSNRQPHSGRQLISHLCRAEKEAMTVFTEIQSNHYQYGTLGRSREALESMTCDCQYDPGQSSLLLPMYASFCSFSFLFRPSLFH
jgi:hypothetical protein